MAVTSTTLIITGRHFDPDEVSRRLGLLPSQSWRRGEVKSAKFKDGFERVLFGSLHEQNGWKLWLDESWSNGASISR